MDFRLSEDSDLLRSEVRSFLDQTMTREFEERLYDSGVSDDAEFVQELERRGWLHPDIPDFRGETHRDPLEVLALKEELQKAEAAVYAVAMKAMIIKVILAIGTPELQNRLLPDALSGKIKIVLGFSETEAGSDVAAVTTK